MPLPRWIARLNKRVTNRFIEPLVRHSRHFVIVHHVGRETGTRYRTPLFAFWSRDTGYVALTYGPGADWVRNALAGPIEIESRDGTLRTATGLHVTAAAAARPAVPRILWWLLRVVRVREFVAFRAERIAV